MADAGDPSADPPPPAAARRRLADSSKMLSQQAERSKEMISKQAERSKEMISKQAERSKEMLSKQAVKIAKQAEEHERFINKGRRMYQGPLAWALIVWRCSLVFSSVDKIVSVLIHLFPGIVFFTIRWWNPETFAAMHPANRAARVSWPYVEDKSYLWMWLFVVPLVAYTLWQLLYFLIVDVLRRQRLLRDPEVMTSYRELSKKAQKANNIWWRLSGLLGDQNRPIMYILLQGAFSVATMALTVPIFLSYRMHVTFQILKVSATIWNGGSFLLEVMPRQVIQKEKRKLEMKPIPEQNVNNSHPISDKQEVGITTISEPLEPDHLVSGQSTNNNGSSGEE